VNTRILGHDELLAKQLRELKDNPAARDLWLSCHGGYDLPPKPLGPMLGAITGIVGVLMYGGFGLLVHIMSGSGAGLISQVGAGALALI